MAQREVDVLRQRNKTLARQNRYLEGQLEHVQEALKRHLSSRKRQKGYDSTEVDTLRVHVESLKNEITQIKQENRKIVARLSAERVLRFSRIAHNEPTVR
mmetsp:Transcript_13884/g.24833  ORF Transcript_13884/g.24833 Transcript_13884/m.24833 type:complete len:100 (+) Transcript_13884:1771-2070(+)